MGKLDNIVYYNNETGEEIEYEILQSIVEEEKRNEIKKLFNIYNDNPEKLTFEEVSNLRKIIQKNKLKHQSNKGKVYLKYEDGFYMVAINSEDNLKQLSLDTNGMLHLVGFNINKSGIIIYKNNRPIRSFEKLREFMSISDRVWRRIKKEIDDFDIIRKINIKNETYLSLNPKFSSIAYEITELKFVAFHDYFKSVIDYIDYLYLCKQFDIIL